MARLLTLSLNRLGGVRFPLLRLESPSSTTWGTESVSWYEKAKYMTRLNIPLIVSVGNASMIWIVVLLVQIPSLEYIGIWVACCLSWASLPSLFTSLRSMKLLRTLNLCARYIINPCVLSKGPASRSSLTNMETSKVIVRGTQCCLAVTTILPSTLYLLFSPWTSKWPAMSMNSGAGGGGGLVGRMEEVSGRGRLSCWVAPRFGRRVSCWLLFHTIAWRWAVLNARSAEPNRMLLDAGVWDWEYTRADATGFANPQCGRATKLW